MQSSELIDKIAPALVKAQGELKHALKDSTNPHFKSKYADLGSVWAAVKPALMKHELAALQDCGALENHVSVGTRIIHSSGQWLAFDPVIIPLSKKDAQGVGSALTYARRYSLSAALGVVADEDDDGNAASRGADAQSIPEPDKVKNAPGISKAKTWVAEFIRDGMACDNGGAFMELCKGTRSHWVKICGVYPNLYQGPDGSGLRGEAQKVATIMECRDEFDLFVANVESSAEGLKVAAE